MQHLRHLRGIKINDKRTVSFQGENLCVSNTGVFSFQGVGIDMFHSMQKCYHFRVLE